MSTKPFASWPAPTDPITAFYMEIAQALLNNTYLAGGSTPLLQLGNLNVWCDGVQQNLLANIQAGNTPELTLVQTLDSLHPWGGTSKSADIKQTIMLVAVTNTMQIAKINAVKYGVMGAMYNAIPERWTFNGINYVKDFNVTDGGDGSSGITLPAQPEGSAQRGINAQGTIMNFVGNLYVPKSNLPT